MKRRLNILIVLVISFIVLSFDVNAISSQVEECPTGNTCNGPFATAYKKGIQTVNVSEANTAVVIYAESTCSTGQKCSYKYIGGYTDVEDVLKRAVKCTNGEKYISYVFSASNGDSVKNANEKNFDGHVYWETEYKVTCTKENTGGNVVELNNSSSSGNSSSSNTSNSGSDYNSSSTVENPEQGVNTYFMVLGVIGIISYVFMMIVKKYNLFKKI